MIAPIRHAPARRARRGRSLATARHAVAAVLLAPVSRRAALAPRVSNPRAWLFVAWTVAVVASYFLLGSWWQLDPR